MFVRYKNQDFSNRYYKEMEEKNMSNENKRFEVTSHQGTIKRVEVLVDKETGVNYLFCADGNAGGLTVMVDAEGKPIVTK